MSWGKHKKVQNFSVPIEKKVTEKIKMVMKVLQLYLRK